MKRSVVLAFLLCGAAACGPGGGDDDGACADLLPGELVITEIFADHAAPAGGSGEDVGKEWIEIYNAGGAAIDLEGLTIGLWRLDDAEPAKEHVFGSVTVAAGEHLVIGNVAPEFVGDTGYLDYGYGDDLGELYNTGSGKLTITCGVTAIDEAQYGDADSGRSTAFDGGTAPDYTANDDVTRWCSTPEEAAYAFEEANYGTPGAENFDCAGGGNGMCDDNGTLRLPVAPVAGDLVITEVMPDPDAVGDTAGEWFEVLATADVDLNGLEISRIGDVDPDVVSAAECLHLAAGEYAIFAANTTMAENGGLPVPIAELTLGLSNSNADVQIAIGGAVLDTYAWTTVRAGESRQLDAAITDANGNDDPLQWCDGNTAYGAGDLGTPGAANESCGGSATMCTDPDTQLARPVVTPIAGQLTISEWMPDPRNVTDDNGEWFEVHATVPVDLNGLQAGTTTLGTTPIVAPGGTCLEVPAGGYAVFAGAASGHGLPGTVDGTFSFNLGNTTSNLVIGFGGVVQDTRTGGAATAGSSFQIDTDGTQCVAPAGTAAYNTVDTTSDFGTPRAVHTVECP
jgi:hypothetical protein